MCLRSWMKAQVITLPKDCLLMVSTLLVDNHAAAAALPGGAASTAIADNAAASIDAQVTMIAIQQEDWAEEVLADGIVGTLNI
jgi:hypothetical protein